MRDDTIFNAFVDWLKTKPADEEYSYINAQNCAFSQFLRDTGRAAAPSCCMLGWRDRVNDTHDGDFVRTPMDERLSDDDARRDPLHAGTFGGILQRLKENGHVPHND